MKIPDIKYETVNLKDVIMHRADPDNNARVVTSIEVNSESLISTQRFMTSFCAIYGVSPSIFNYFGPDEVIERIVQVIRKNKKNAADHKVRIAIEENGSKKTALAVSRTNKPFITKNDVETILAMHNVADDDIEYRHGVIRSWHIPRIGGDADWKVMSDVFKNRFVMDIPIDGYGLPAAFLSALREVCDNGLIGATKAFRSHVQLGRKQSDALDTMLRFLESFNNEEGYAALRQRLIAASESPASLEEFFAIYSLLLEDEMATLHKDEHGYFCKPHASVLMKRMRDLCGSLETYGLVNYDALSRKKRRTIPTAGRLYDLVNFITEVSTHDANPEQSRKLHAWIGGLLANEYDLEGVLETIGEDPQDLFMGDTRTSKDKFAMQGDRVLEED